MNNAMKRIFFFLLSFAGVLSSLHAADFFYLEADFQEGSSVSRLYADQEYVQYSDNDCALKALADQLKKFFMSLKVGASKNDIQLYQVNFEKIALHDLTVDQVITFFKTFTVLEKYKGMTSFWHDSYQQKLLYEERDIPFVVGLERALLAQVWQKIKNDRASRILDVLEKLEKNNFDLWGKSYGKYQKKFDTLKEDILRVLKEKLPKLKKINTFCSVFNRLFTENAFQGNETKEFIGSFFLKIIVRRGYENKVTCDKRTTLLDLLSEIRGDALLQEFEYLVKGKYQEMLQEELDQPNKNFDTIKLLVGDVEKKSWTGITTYARAKKVLSQKESTESLAREIKSILRSDNDSFQKLKCAEIQYNLAYEGLDDEDVKESLKKQYCLFQEELLLQEVEAIQKNQDLFTLDFFQEIVQKYVTLLDGTDKSKGFCQSAGSIITLYVDRLNRIILESCDPQKLKEYTSVTDYRTFLVGQGIIGEDEYKVESKTINDLLEIKQQRIRSLEVIQEKIGKDLQEINQAINDVNFDAQRKQGFEETIKITLENISESIHRRKNKLETWDQKIVLPNINKIERNAEAIDKLYGVNIQFAKDFNQAEDKERFQQNALSQEQIKKEDIIEWNHNSWGDGGKYKNALSDEVQRLFGNVFVYRQAILDKKPQLKYLTINQEKKDISIYCFQKELVEYAQQLSFDSKCQIIQHEESQFFILKHVGFFGNYKKSFKDLMSSPQGAHLKEIEQIILNDLFAQFASGGARADLNIKDNQEDLGLFLQACSQGRPSLNAEQEAQLFVLAKDLFWVQVADVQKQFGEKPLDAAAWKARLDKTEKKKKLFEGYYQSVKGKQAVKDALVGYDHDAEIAAFDFWYKQMIELHENYKLLEQEYCRDTPDQAEIFLTKVDALALESDDVKSCREMLEAAQAMVTKQYHDARVKYLLASLQKIDGQLKSAMTHENHADVYESLESFNTESFETAETEKKKLIAEHATFKTDEEKVIDALETLKRVRQKTNDLFAHAHEEQGLKLLNDGIDEAQRAYAVLQELDAKIIAAQRTDSMKTAFADLLYRGFNDWKKSVETELQKHTEKRALIKRYEKFMKKLIDAKKSAEERFEKTIMEQLIQDVKAAAGGFDAVATPEEKAKYPELVEQYKKDPRFDIAGWETMIRSWAKAQETLQKQRDQARKPSVLQQAIADTQKQRKSEAQAHQKACTEKQKEIADFKERAKGRVGIAGGVARLMLFVTPILGYKLYKAKDRYEALRVQFIVTYPDMPVPEEKLFKKACYQEFGISFFEKQWQHFKKQIGIILFGCDESADETVVEVAALKPQVSAPEVKIL